jgi:hypothetical protein
MTQDDSPLFKVLELRQFGFPVNLYYVASHDKLMDRGWKRGGEIANFFENEFEDGKRVLDEDFERWDTADGKHGWVSVAPRS